MMLSVNAASSAPGSSSSSSSHHPRRGHAHKRSAAISGDFDLDFFSKGPSINENLVSSSLPSESYMAKRAPVVVITEPQSPRVTSPPRTASTPSPAKKSARINSWASSFIKSKPKESVEGVKLEYTSSSSNETTPESQKQGPVYSYNSSSSRSYSAQYQQVPQPHEYKIPEAIIDLDLASGIYHDPSGAIPTKMTKLQHRRTESAPELEDFFKYKVFSTNSNKNSRRNSAIYEEEEEDDEDGLSSTSSTNNIGGRPGELVKNPSTNSLNSNSSANKVSSPSFYQQSLTSTPTSTKTRRGASAARYQSYYQNSALLSNALKSSESLSQVTNNSNSINNTKTSTAATSLHKSSIPSFHTPKQQLTQSFSSSSTSSINSSVMNSPSRFKFESKVYDMPSSTDSTHNLSQEPADNTNNIESTPKIKIHTPKKSISKATPKKSHKKSNSLLGSLTAKIRRNSTSSTKSDSQFSTNNDDVKHKACSSSSLAYTSSNSQTVDGDDDEEDEGETTITPFNFGEPGPALDLTTMTPKYYSDDGFDHEELNLNLGNNNNNNNNVIKTHITNGDESLKSPRKSTRKAFLQWIKK